MQGQPGANRVIPPDENAPGSRTCEAVVAKVVKCQQVCIEGCPENLRRNEDDRLDVLFPQREQSVEYWYPLFVRPIPTQCRDSFEGVTFPHFGQ